MVDFLKQQLVSITHLDNNLFIDTVGVPKSTLVSKWVMFVKICCCSTSYHLVSSSHHLAII